ncbi:MULTISPECIES: hypothetical protein [unclassified Streptomyces]|uniref:hypothetical protein n=1 Tax=unclassified Streptomyces TaxID=2593676 RepID=UPI00226EF960|nr:MULTISPECIES: hypothetical protein [unclassified Streptomyces]MCY0921858.1 hypothetical protein [Streptomyces sp. H27-G5]MCY0957192.1 hypothetical protein [Streptomyces sp. H27-H5]
MNLCLCGTELVDDTHLCPRCRAATSGRLRRLPVLYRLLRDELQPTASGPANFGGRVRHVEAPMPVSAHVLTLRGPGGIVGVLEQAWTAVQASYGGTAPRIAGSYDERVSTAADFLGRHLAYIVTWPKAAVLAAEIRQIDEAAMEIVCPRDTMERGTRLGPCPATIGDGVCGATLRHYAGQPGITCRWCAVVYPAAAWADLKTWMDEDAQPAREEVMATG